MDGSNRHSYPKLVISTDQLSPNTFGSACRKIPGSDMDAPCCFPAVLGQGADPTIVQVNIEVRSYDCDVV